MQSEILLPYFLNGVIVYIDDTIIYGVDEESFWNVLNNVLGTMASRNDRLKPSKCLFGMVEIEFLGHVFNEFGMRLSDARVQGIIDMPIPNSVKQVRSFIGMVNYFRDFVPELAHNLILLLELTKKRWLQLKLSDLVEKPKKRFVSKICWSKQRL
jgi:hypothetical protein